MQEYVVIHVHIGANVLALAPGPDYLSMNR
jgi:hypothetical protein